ncbi:unnamed protein product [Effrenium voratum]|uniref:JmjC domain-containing protein n=1 Tax=Effrenium voratum TaxID=2562239 RepID=A0AA36J5J9_9DINO|nr:unnamed protein product [Effrenium voratum]
MALAGLGRAARAHAVAFFGNDLQACKELFRLLDAGAASDWRHAKALLAGRKGLPWQRVWRETLEDPQLFWASDRSHALGAPDLHTPLSCVLLASPRHRLAAMLQKWETGSGTLRKAQQQFLRLPASSLGGLTARKMQEAGPAADPGAAARAAVAEWRRAACALLLDSASAGLVSLADAQGRTALHLAAAAGDVEVVEMLLEHGAQKNAQDVHGRSPAHIAAARRHRDVAAKLMEGDACDAFGHTVRSLLDTLDAESLGPRPKMAEVQAEDVPPERFLRDFVAANRPVLLRNGAAHLEAMRWSDYRQLQQDLGSEQVHAAPVPYAKNLGLPGAIEAPLSQLLSSPKLWRSESAASGAASGAEGEAPCYVFDAAVLRRRSELAEKALPLTRAFMKEHCSHVRQPQFGVGFRGAGAPMHTHHAALNASLAGRKRWFLMPPEVAGWTLDPVAGWEGSEDFERKRKAGLWEVTQEAGDLLFVPEGWGHATILDSYAVGVAQEFVPWSSVNG